MTTEFRVHEVQKVGRPLGTVLRPTTVADALEALRGHPGSRPLAGGTDLLLDLQRGGTGVPVDVVDLSGIVGFASIADVGDHFELGGGVRHNQVIAHDGLVASALPLAQACLEVGSPQLRNRATIAGNLATASPANDTISALMALGASIELSSLVGISSGSDAVSTRMVAVEDFFTGFRQTVLKAGELITAIHVPKLAANQRGLWVKLGLRKAQAISVVHAGVVLTFDSDLATNSALGATITDARLALGSVAPTVQFIDEFADELVGGTLGRKSIAAAAERAAAAVTPISDGRATAVYRSRSINVLIRRSLGAIFDGTHESMWPESPPTLSTPGELEQASPVSSATVLAEDEISIQVNGQTVRAGNAGLTLLDWVRTKAASTGSKEGCAEGECGACTMLLNGSAVMSCLVPAVQANGADVTTIEGLEHPIQQAFINEFAVQCGFCIPGFLVSGARLIEETGTPSDAQINLALSGNLCRCTGYYPIVNAVKAAAVEIRV